MKLSRVSTFVLLLSPLALTLATGTYAQDQYPILDKVAAKVVWCRNIRAHRANSYGKRNKHHPNHRRHKSKRQSSF
jgi:hypothetical protein